MTVPTHNAFHREEAWELLTGQLKQNAELLEKLSTALYYSVQELEDALYSLTFDRLLDTAMGAALDQLGGIVGEGRGDLTDAEYRRFIAARILINSTHGELPYVHAALQVMTEAERVYTYMCQPATVVCDYWVRSPLRETVRARVAANMLDAVAEGIEVAVVEAPWDLWYGFDEATDSSPIERGLLAEVITP